MPTAAELELLEDEARRFVVDEYYVDKVHGASVSRVVDVRKVDEAVPAAQRKVRDADALPVSGFAKGWDTGRNRCMFDIIRRLHGDKPGATRICKRDEYIALAMLGELGEYGSDAHVAREYAALDALAAQHAPRVRALLEEGVTAEQALAYCKAVKCTCILLDEDERIILEHKPPRAGNHAVTPLVWRVNSGHAHPVMDPALVYSFAHRGNEAFRKLKAAARASGGEPKQGKKSAPLLELQAVEGVQGADARWQYLLDEIRERGELPHSVQLSKDGLAGYLFYDDASRKRGTKTVINANLKVARFLARRLGLPEGSVTSLGGIHHRLAEAHLPKLRCSRPNAAVQEWFSCTNGRNNVHSGLLSDWKSEEALEHDLRRGHVECADMTSAYPFSMYQPLSPWALLSHNAVDVPYDGTPVCALPVGLYLVRTEDHVLLNGDRPVVREELQLAERHGVAFTIERMLVADDTMGVDTFRPYFDAVLRLTHPFDLPPDVDAEELRAARKRLNVMLYGQLSKVYETQFGRAHVTEDFADVCGYRMEQLKRAATGFQTFFMRSMELNPGATVGPLDKLWKLKPRKLFVYAMQDEAVMLSHNAPMAVQIQGFLNARLFHMMTALGGAPIAFKTDAVMLYKPRRSVEEAQPPREALIDVTALPVICAEDARVDAFCKADLARWGTYKRERPWTPCPRLRDAHTRELFAPREWRGCTTRTSWTAGRWARYWR
jgi:hypothetical protein